MKYRRFGSLDFQVSALGFGTMRLPTLGGNPEDIDEEAAVEVIRHAIDGGVNYIDSGYPYHGGNSERLVAKAVRDGYREKVRIATKLPTWACKDSADFDRFFEEQCERLESDRIDFYLLHNLQAPFWESVRALGVLDWLDKLLSDGRVGHVGFSFHDEFDLLEEVVEAYDQWTVCQLQYNYMNEQVQAGTRGVEFAAGKGLAVVVMEPLLGGCLVHPPPVVQAIWDGASVQRGPAEWALQWLWHKAEVSVVLSGMGAMAEVRENLASAERSRIGGLTSEELRTVSEARKQYASLHVVPCTRCGYCMPCPEGVDIPKNLQLYNDALVFEGNQRMLNRNIYFCLPERQRAAGCAACGQCEEKCPQSIPIREWMPKVAAQFGAT